MDYCYYSNYSPPLYQLSYRRLDEKGCYSSVVVVKSLLGVDLCCDSGFLCFQYCFVQVLTPLKHVGGVAQMVERSLSMREVPGSIPGASIKLFDFMLDACMYFFTLSGKMTFKHVFKPKAKRNEKIATSGNRTRAARVAGEHSTTEPTLLHMERAKFKGFL